MKIFYRVLFSFILVSSLSLSFVVPIFAATSTDKIDRVKLDNPITAKTIPEIFGNGIKVTTGIMGSLALLVFVYGGAVWLTSAGNPEKVKKGTAAMVWAVLGIVVIFSSYAIINLVLNGLGVN
jgi:hypothetical protein